MKRLIIIGLLLLLPIYGCGSGGGGGDNKNPQSPSVNVAGNWSGSWLSGNGIDKGTLSLSLTQNSSDFSGTININGSPCFSVGNISGVVSGNNITSGGVFAGSLRVDFDGTVVNNKITGSYNVVNAGACTGDTGTWNATK